MINNEFVEISDQEINKILFFYKWYAIKCILIVIIYINIKEIDFNFTELLFLRYSIYLFISNIFYIYLLSYIKIS